MKIWRRCWGHCGGEVFRTRQEPRKAVSYIRLRHGSAMIFLPSIDVPFYSRQALMEWCSAFLSTMYVSFWMVCVTSRRRSTPRCDSIPTCITGVLDRNARFSIPLCMSHRAGSSPVLIGILLKPNGRMRMAVHRKRAVVCYTENVCKI